MVIGHTTAGGTSPQAGRRPQMPAVRHPAPYRRAQSWQCLSGERRRRHQGGVPRHRRPRGPRARRAAPLPAV